MVLTLSVLPDLLGICRFALGKGSPPWVIEQSFFSVTQTEAELSIVCPQVVVPPEITCERGWRCLKVHGPLDFELTGVLAAMTTVLAEAGISIFALSTYDTDYVLVREHALAQACRALREAGHKVIE